MSRIYISNETDPYFNIAAEYQMFSNASNDTWLFLWQNSPAVIIGRNQNIYAECDMKYLESNNILPVRRFSGGGAVFQDLGNVNFTFIAKEENVDVEKYIFVIKKALSSFGIECEFSGRNDLLYKGKKFSGHAYYADKGNYLYHGTIMVNVNMDMLSGALKPPILKLKSKGIDSVRSRVINLCQVHENITTQAIKQAFINSFKEVFDESASIEYINSELFEVPLLEKIMKDEWIYGEAPEFSLSSERKLSCGNVTVVVDVLNGLIRNVKIQSDSISVLDFSECEKNLIGVHFKEDSVFEYIEEFTQKQLKQ